MFLNDDYESKRSASVTSTATISSAQLAILYQKLDFIDKRFDDIKKSLVEQEFRRLNPPTFKEHINAILLPSMREYVICAFPLTGFFGFHHYYYTDDFSLALMCCVFPGVFWLMDLLSYFFHKQHIYWKYIRIIYTIVFFFIGIVAYAALTDIKKKLPSPEITTFAFLTITNTIGISTFFYSSLLFRMFAHGFPLSEYFSVVCFSFAYYYEQTRKTTKLNELNQNTKRVIYILAVGASLGYYKNALLDRETHMKTRQMLGELFDSFSFTFQNANQQIKNNIVELKNDIILNI